MISEIKQRITQLNNGEVPNGYENTDFGIFPCDWVKDKTFGDLFDFYGGLGKSRDELGDEGHAYLHYGDLHRGAFNVVSHEQYEQLPKYDVVLKGTETYLMEDGDVAFLDASEDLEGTSRSVLIDNPDNEPFIAGLHVIFGKSKNNSLEKWYKQYITATDSVRKQFQRLASGFKVYGVTRETLPKIQIAYPKSADEQSKIAEILMKWDEAIELYDKLVSILITKRDAIVQKIVSANAEWKEYSLSDILQEKNEYSQKNNEHAVLSSTKQGIFYQSDYFDKQVASENNIGYKIVCRGDIVLSPQNLWLGNINYNDVFEIGIVSPSYKIFEIKSGYDKTLISTIMKQPSMFHQYVLASEQGASIVRRNLNMNLFYKIKIILPSIEKQNQLGKIIETINKHISLCKLQLENIKSQRKILQQYLLNGIVRVEV